MQEPGSSYYLNYPGASPIVDGQWLLVKYKDAIVAIFNRDCIVYAIMENATQMGNRKS